MAEIAFLDAVSAWFAGPAGLVPAPAAVGFAAPGQGDVLPMIALELDGLVREDRGLGGGMTEISSGSLPVQARINLADPVLPGPDPLLLLDPTRTVLTLPHGGLVRADRLDGALGPGDFAVTVAGAPVPLVAAPPAAGQAALEPDTGTLTFGTPLPAAGLVVADYFLGIWERSSTTVTGTLLIDIWASSAADLAALTAAAVRSLTDPAGAPMPNLRSARLARLGGSTGPAAGNPPRVRRAEIAFRWDHVVDRPVSSGGIIGRVALTTHTPGRTRDPATGAMTDTTATEADV